MANRSRTFIWLWPLFVITASCADNTEKTGMGATDWVIQRVVVDDAVIDSRNPYDVIDPLWWTGDIYGTTQDYEASLNRFSREQRLVFAAIWYISEVNNGGHHQFYWNSTGIVWPDAVSAFREVGLGDVVEILEESAKRLGGPPSRDRDERQRQLEISQAEFDDLDSRFYELQNSQDLDSALADFIQEHRERFHFDGSVRKPDMRK